MAYLLDMISKFSQPPGVRLACRKQHWFSTIIVTLHIDKYVVCLSDYRFSPGMIFSYWIVCPSLMIDNISVSAGLVR